MRWKFIAKLALILGVALVSTSAAQAQIGSAGPVASPALSQIDALTSEAQGWLIDLIRINTSPAAAATSTARAAAVSPAAPAAPGATSPILGNGAPLSPATPDTNEIAAAKYVARILQKENISTEIVETAPGQAVVIAKLQAGPLPGPSNALLLVAHLDVANVTRSKRTVDPFAGTVRDGYLYGRGVLEDKGMLVANLAAMVALKRSGVHLTRDVIFLADGGKEPANPAGMKTLADRFWDKIACGFAIHEGGTIPLASGTVQYVGVEAGEKVPYDVRVTASGSPGPASIPRADDAVTHLAAAIVKLGDINAPPQLMTLTRRYFEALAAIEDDETAKWMRALETERFSLAVIRLSEMNPEWGAMLHDTIAPSELEASAGADVLPSEARANLHVQLLPGNPMSPVLALMEKTVADPKIKFQVDPDSGVAAPESSLDSPLYRSIARSAPEQFPGTTVVPMLSPETSGSAELRLRNVQAYGLAPFPLSAADEARREGDDERLPLTSFRTGLEFLYRTVYDFAATH